jgi:hypothetical protein
LLKDIYSTIKKHGSSLAFIAGFIWDNVMLDRIDHGFARLMLTTYLILAALIILILNSHEARRSRGKEAARYAVWLPLILQFCFGSLFSAYIIFYTHSASLAVSWPFIVFLVFLVISNEIFHKRYLSPAFQLPIFFIVLFSYSIFSLPIILGRMGSDVFIMSGLFSLAVIYILALTSRILAPEVFAKGRMLLWTSIISIYVIFNLAYFSNIIPPVPLSLKEIGVFHSVSKSGSDSYLVSYEPGPWHPILKDTSKVFNRFGSEGVYVFSSVFAPTNLTVPIFYSWAYFDEADKVWVTTDRLEFKVSGGREEGYRGYYVKKGVFPGLWRVDIETARKETVGRLKFKIVPTSEPIENLVTETR